VSPFILHHLVTAGGCTLHFAIDNEDKLPVQSAWRIDRKFAAIELRGLLCGREGLGTADRDP
jgi:hypothetical protein